MHLHSVNLHSAENFAFWTLCRTKQGPTVPSIRKVITAKKTILTRSFPMNLHAYIQWVLDYQDDRVQKSSLMIKIPTIKESL